MVRRPTVTHFEAAIMMWVTRTKKTRFDVGDMKKEVGQWCLIKAWRWKTWIIFLNLWMFLYPLNRMVSFGAFSTFRLCDALLRRIPPYLTWPDSSKYGSGSSIQKKCRLCHRITNVLPQTYVYPASTRSQENMGIVKILFKTISSNPDIWTVAKLGLTMERKWL